MKKPKEIDPTQARETVRAGHRRLVCAHDGEEKRRKLLPLATELASEPRESCARLTH